MGKRIRVAINYQYNENWIGGSYYIQNLIFALNCLQDFDKPILLINSPSQDALENLKEITSYPYLEKYPELNKLQKGLNLFSRLFFNRNFFDLRKTVDVIFPASFDRHSIQDRIIVNSFLKKNIFSIENQEDKIFSKDIFGSNFLKKEIFWIPDFQEKYLPHFFTELEIKERDTVYKKIQKNAFSVVFSSLDAQRDFNLFYPNAKPHQFVLSFATHHNQRNLPTKESVFKKFNISTEYFLCSNQFWKHKNHSVVLRATALLKKEGLEISIIFTGKEYDYRNPNYFSSLMKEVEELGVKENVKFLGFIERDEQIVLLKNCKAILQPSLFEGWSTVNEDAKAENIFILASDLEVNKEQLKDYPNNRLFNPNNEENLAEEIRKDNFECEKIDYQKNIQKFADKFLEIINNVKDKS